MTDCLTLRYAYERYLRPDHKPRTIDTYRSLINHWEAARLTVPTDEPGRLHLRIERINPDLTAVDNATLADFKSYLQARLAQNTVRSKLKHLARIFSRLGPADYRNKDGLGLLPMVPYVRPPAEILRPVVPIEQSEIEAIYQAAETATWPDCEVPPVLWWRSLIVALYNLGLRRLDYLSARMDEFDLRRGVVGFDAEKTGKFSELPLVPELIEHLRAIWEPKRVLVWPWRWNQEAADPIERKKKSLYDQWHRLRTAAGIAREITPHDLRRTCGSDLFAVSPAAASECLQHSSIVTTQRSYANCSNQTRELMLARKQPAAFKRGDDPEPPPDEMILRFPAS